MQWHACAADLFHQRFAVCLKLFQIRWTNCLVCRCRENDVSHFQIAHRSIVRRRKGIDLFCYAQRRFSDFVVWTDIADHGGVNRISENDQRIIAGFNRFTAVRKCARHHDKGIGRADEKAVFFQRIDFGTQQRDRIPQLALAHRSSSSKCILVFCVFQRCFAAGQVWIRRGRFLLPAIAG